MVTAGLAAALLAITAIQLPNAALALDPQPEPPSKFNPQPGLQKKKTGKSQKRYPPNPFKGKTQFPPNPFKR
jgi:hypothetical protein